VETDSLGVESDVVGVESRGVGSLWVGGGVSWVTRGEPMMRCCGDHLGGQSYAQGTLMLQCIGRGALLRGGQGSLGWQMLARNRWRASGKPRWHRQRADEWWRTQGWLPEAAGR
jgi:hypothetical protein